MVMLPIPHPKDQGALPACAAAAVASAIEISDGLGPASLQFVYYNAVRIRKNEKLIRMTDALVAAQRYGVCGVSSYQYSDWPGMPSRKAMQEGRQRRIDTPLLLKSVLEIHRALDRMMPCVASVNGSLFGADIGNHAVVILGYENNGEKLFIHNSWGETEPMEMSWSFLQRKGGVRAAFAVSTRSHRLI